MLETMKAPHHLFTQRLTVNLQPALSMHIFILQFYMFLGHESIVRMLIQHEAKINIKDNRGRTPLHYATEGGHEDVVKLLMQHGADAAIRTPGSFNPFFFY